jgi:hypothetical protein
LADVWLAARRKYKGLLRKHKRVYHLRKQMGYIAAYFGRNPDDFWRALRGKSSAALPSLSDIAGWEQHFEQLLNAHAVNALFGRDAATAETDALLPQPSSESQLALAGLNDPITEGEVDEALGHLQRGKAAGADGITAEALKVRAPAAGPNAGPAAVSAGASGAAGGSTAAAPGEQPAVGFVLTPVLTALLNRLFVGGNALPDVLATNTLTPLLKPGGTSGDYNSYRGIAVGSVVCKLYESVLNARLSERAETQGLRAASQCGFRPGHGTMDGQFILRHFIDKHREEGRSLYAVFVDFSKAFDLIDRGVLIDVWRRMGVSGPFLDALARLYDRVLMRVKLCGRLGKPFETRWGTKQGSPLSPLLFGGMIEQLCRLIARDLPGVGPLLGGVRVPHILYADDVVLLTETPEDMQELLKILSVFCELFGMKVNLTKTKAVVFRAGARARRNVRLVFQGQPVEFVNEYKYLGVLFDSKEGCSVGADQRAACGQRAVFSLLGRARALQLDQSDFLCRLFDQLVEPALSYGCQLWGPGVASRAFCRALATPTAAQQLQQPRPAHVLDKILDSKIVPAEAAHGGFLRHLGGLPASTPKWLVLAEFGRQPLVLRWLTLTARWWERMVVLNAARQAPVGEGDSPSGCSLTIDAWLESIGLFLDNPVGDSWASEFLRCMHMLGVADARQCTSVTQVLALDITEESVRRAGEEGVRDWWQHAGGDHPDPRTVPGHDVWYSTYRQWVQGGAETPTPHLKSFLEYYKDKRTLARLRVSSFPLRVCTGRNEGSGEVNEDGSRGTRRIPRDQRTCKVCGNTHAVEDLKHFLLECPHYAQIRSRWSNVFGNHTTPSAVLGQANQAKLARAVCDMLYERGRKLGIPWRP